MAPNVDEDLKVVEIEVLNLIWHNVEHRRIGDENITELNIFGSNEVDQMRSSGVNRMDVLAHPPVISISINSSSLVWTVDSNI